MNDTPLSVRFAEKSADLAALEAAVLDVADNAIQADTDSTWQSMTCTEVEALAHAFTLAGDENAAKTIIKRHAAADEEGDMHYEEPVFIVTVSVRPAPDTTNEDVSRIVSEYLQAVNSPVFECDLIAVDTKEAQ